MERRLTTQSVALLVLLAATTGACGQEPAAGRPMPTIVGQGAKPEPRRVRTAQVSRELWPQSLRVPAELAPAEMVTLSAEIAGRVEEVSVDIGTRVPQGAPIAKLRTRELELSVAAAEAALAVARARLGTAWDEEAGRFDPAGTVLVRQQKTELEDAQREHARLLPLVDEGVSTQAELDRAETRLRRAQGAMENALQEVTVLGALTTQRQAELDLAREALAHAEPVAPFAGLIAERLVGPGDFVTRGAALVILLKDDPLRLRLRLSEREAPLVRIGQRVLLQGAGLQELVGEIARLAPALAESSRTLQAEVDVPNAQGNLRSGQFLEAEIIINEEHEALCVPAEALVSFAGIDKLLVVEAEVAHEASIVVGRRSAERIEILSGVSEAAVVVLAPGRLQNGDPVIQEP